MLQQLPRQPGHTRARTYTHTHTLTHSQEWLNTKLSAHDGLTAADFTEAFKDPRVVCGLVEALKAGSFEMDSVVGVFWGLFFWLFLVCFFFNGWVVVVNWDWN